jgi:aldehyde:ferredoxin oxidoreductase
MFGWNGKFLQVNLSKNKAVAEKYEANIAKNFLGGRGFAAKILWDELKTRIDPLSPENRLVFATGLEITLEDLNLIADRTFNLIRAFWIREYGKNWSTEMDVPPARWFEEPLSKGALKGAKLDRTKYDVMLQRYYKKRGWDERGIPTKTTLKRLGLEDVAKQLKKRVKLFD